MITWIIAFLIVISVLILILSISTILDIFKYGFKEYIVRFKILLYLYGKLDISILIDEVKTYTYHYNYVTPNVYPTCKSASKNVINYYFPVFKTNKNLILVNKKEFSLVIYNVNDISDELYEYGKNILTIQRPYCIWSNILYLLFYKKMDKLSKNSINIKNIDELNTYIANKFISLKRESALKLILS